MKILVTGGAGFIGSWLCDDLLKNGHSVIVVDNLSPQIHGALPQPDMPWLCNEDAEFIRADIRDRIVMDKVLGRVEAVIHLAAETGTGQSMYQIAHYYDVNQQATAMLFEGIATRHRHISCVVLASSRSIYGEGAYKLFDRVLVPAPRTFNRMQSGEFEPLGPEGEELQLMATPEDVSPRPASVYAATKLANEMLGSIFADAFGTKVVALRFQNVYGERQSLQNPYTGILSIFSNRMRLGLPINIFEDGCESRDFVNVRDVVRAISMALEQPISGFYAINIGSGVPSSVLEITDILRSYLGSNSQLNVTGDFRIGDIRHCYADLSYARKVLGFEPTINIKQGLELFCKWVLTKRIQEDQSEKAMIELANYRLSRIK